MIYFRQMMYDGLECVNIQKIQKKKFILSQKYDMSLNLEAFRLPGNKQEK